MELKNKAIKIVSKVIEFFYITIAYMIFIKNSAKGDYFKAISWLVGLVSLGTAIILLLYKLDEYISQKKNKR